MRYYQDFNPKQALYALILNFAALGCAIIPTIGKRPAFSWKAFQQEAPSLADLVNWFNPQRAAGYDAAAIITGRVSNLVVLDFDTQDVFYAFREALPELIQTYIVQTRRGFHVYLRVPEHLPMPRSRSLENIDVQGPGRYVIMQGSQIDSFTYQRYQDATANDLSQAREVTAADLDRIEDYLSQQTAKEQTAPVEPTVTILPNTADNLIQRYEMNAQATGSRNIALYNTATAARRAGMTRADVEAKLIETHVTHPPMTAHPPETAEQRRTEATRTIASAFNGNLASEIRSETIAHDQSENRGLLPNAVREALIQHSGTLNARLLEAIYSMGFQAGERLTERQMNIIARNHHMSKRTVSRCIRGEESSVGDGRRIYQKHSTPGEEWNSSVEKGTPHYVGDIDKRSIKEHYGPSDRGRQTSNWYEVPSIEYLCEILEVTPQAADPLSSDDLRSPKAYRMGMQRELVGRLSPEWKMERYAQRLGVSTRTIQRYNAEIGTIATPVFGYIPLDWSNVDDPSLYGEPRPNNVTPGQWLQREDGKRFPAIKGIALQQLADGEDLVVCKRLPSRLQLPETAIVVYPVIWRRLDLERDAFDYGGGEYDFPPVSPPPQPYTMPEQPPDKVIMPEQPPDKIITPEQPPDKIITPEQPPDKVITPEQPPDKIITPEQPPDKVITPEQPPDKIITPEQPPDKVITPDFSDGEAENVVSASSDDQIMPDLDASYEELALARLEESTLSPHEYELFNTTPTLVSGIGESRADRLYDLGIVTLTQLIAVGSERLGRVYWPGGYVTELTIQRWIDEAELLLGLRTLTADERFEQDLKQARQARRTLSKEYLRLVKQYRTFIETVCEWERTLSGGIYIRTLAYARFRLMKYFPDGKADEAMFRQQQVGEFFDFAQEFIDAYLPRVEIFLAKDDCELLRYSFGDRQMWRSFKRKLMNFQEKFADEKWQALL